MNVFLTGASGLLGSYFLDSCLKNGFHVTVLLRENSFLKDEFQNKVRIVRGTINDLSAIEQGMTNCDLIIHCAALVSFWPADKKNLNDINHEGTKNMVDVALTIPNRPVFLHISSVSTIGNNKVSLVATENDQFSFQNFNSDYGISKYLAEIEVFRGVEEGLSAIIINPSIILGPGDLNKSSTQLIDYILKQKLFFPLGIFNYVDVRDVVRAGMLLINEESAFGRRFIVTGGAVLYKDFFKMAAEIFNVMPPYIPVYPWLASLAWRIEWLKALLFRTKPLITKYTSRSSGSKKVYSNQLIKSTLNNFDFTPLENSIQWICESLKK